MFPATTKGGGTCVVFPDVCKVPAPPAPFVPTPFPDVGQCSDASGGTCTQKIKISNKPTLHSGSEITRSSGDEAGTLKGMISATNMDKVKYRTSVSKVKVEGNPIVTHLKNTAQNGSNANAPPGVQVAPSQTKVIIGL